MFRGGPAGNLVYRQMLATRLTHWTWAVALFFLLLSGLQIFMARPDLYIGEQSGFSFDNSILSIRAEVEGDSLEGITELFGWQFDTTGWLESREWNCRTRTRTAPRYRGRAEP